MISTWECLTTCPYAGPQIYQMYVKELSVLLAEGPNGPEPGTKSAQQLEVLVKDLVRGVFHFKLCTLSQSSLYAHCYCYYFSLAPPNSAPTVPQSMMIMRLGVVKPLETRKFIVVSRQYLGSTETEVIELWKSVMVSTADELRVRYHIA
jgi:hypothetical protein